MFMERLLKIISLLILLVSCEDSKKEITRSEMEALEARMPVVTNKFDRNPSRANCDDINRCMGWIYGCFG